MLNSITRYIVVFTISVVWSVSIFGKDYLIVNWESDSVIVLNPYDSVSVASIGSNVTIASISKDAINIRLQGKSENGSLQISSPVSLNIIMDNLYLKSDGRACIDIQSKKTAEIKIVGDNRLEDGEYRDSILADNTKGALYAIGDIIIGGDGNMIVNANYKHGIYADKSLKIKDSSIEIICAPGDGIRGKKDVSITNSKIKANNIGKHAINSDKSTVKIKNSRVEIKLENADSKGISCSSDLNCENSILDFIINGNGSKGIKCDGNISLVNDSIFATAKGNIILAKDDKTYCTAIKGDSCFIADRCFISISHNGDGGKGISCDKEVLLSNCEVDIAMNGYGAPYLANMGEDIDFFTPRCLESKGDMRIISGKYSLYTSGNGGKGIVCDSLLVIGKIDTPNDSLIINIRTDGTAVVDDIINDKRYGCPKAIKCGKDAYIESGIITTQTKGMGGEGFESKGYLTINGGTLVCESFDDGINVEKGITINGGCIYCTSVDNDGIDSNGFIELNGGVVASLTSHEYDEDFDCDDERFYLNGGTILGLGRNYSGIYKVKQPYIQHVSVYKDRPNMIVDTLSVCNVFKDCFISFAGRDNSAFMTVKVHDSIPCIFGTMSSPTIKNGEEVGVFITEGPLSDSNCVIPDKVWMGGSTHNISPMFSDLATDKPFQPPVLVDMSIDLYTGWNLISVNVCKGIPVGIFEGKASKILSDSKEYIYNPPSMSFISGEGEITDLRRGKAYLVKMEDNFVLPVTGYSVTSTMQYKVSKGWNWISYPGIQETEISKAMRKALLSENDYISDSDDFAIYKNGEWTGTLKKLSPGKGYYFVTGSDKQIQFVY